MASVWQKYKEPLEIDDEDAVVVSASLLSTVWRRLVVESARGAKV